MGNDSLRRSDIVGLAEAGAAVAGLSVEQLAGISEEAPATSGLVAGGPVAGRGENPQGQSSGAAGVGAIGGSAAQH